MKMPKQRTVAKLDTKRAHDLKPGDVMAPRAEAGTLSLVVQQVDSHPSVLLIWATVEPTSYVALLAHHRLPDAVTFALRPEDIVHVVVEEPA